MSLLHLCINDQICVRKEFDILFVCVCIHTSLLTGTRIWKHTRTVGSVQLVGTF